MAPVNARRDSSPTCLAFPSQSSLRKRLEDFHLKMDFRHRSRRHALERDIASFVLSHPNSSKFSAQNGQIACHRVPVYFSLTGNKLTSFAFVGLSLTPT
jgi:hypothetical protein